MRRFGPDYVGRLPAPAPHRAPRYAAVSVRLDPALIARAQLGLMLPAGCPVSVVVRRALELAAGMPELGGEVNGGGWRDHEWTITKEEAALWQSLCVLVTGYPAEARS